MSFFAIKERYTQTQGYTSLYDRLNIGSTAVSDAAWERGWNFTGSKSLGRMYDTSLLKSFEQRVLSGNSLSPEEVNHLLELDTSDELTSFEILGQDQASEILQKEGMKEHLELDGPISNVRLRRLIDRKKESIRNDYILSQAEGKTFWYGMGIEMFAAVADPLNIPLMFSAAFTKPAFLIKRLKDAGKLSANMQLGAYTGAAASTVLEAPILYQASQEQLDYGAVNSVVNIAFGTVFSGGLGALSTLGGMDARAIGNIVAPRDKAGNVRLTPFRGALKYTPLDAQAARSAADQMLHNAKIKKAAIDIENGEPVDVSGVDNIDKNISASDLDQAFIISEDIQKFGTQLQQLEARLRKGTGPEPEKFLSDSQVKTLQRDIKGLKNKINKLQKELGTKFPGVNRLIQKLYEHQNIAVQNMPGTRITVDGLEQTVDPRKEKDPFLKTKFIKQEADKRARLTQSSDELADMMEQVMKEGHNLDHLMAMFDPENKLFTPSMRARRKFPGDNRTSVVDEVKRLLTPVRSKKIRRIAQAEKASKDFNKDIDNPETEYNKKIESKTELAKAMNAKTAAKLEEQLKEIEALYGKTLENKDIKAAINRFINCEDVT